MTTLSRVHMWHSLYNLEPQNLDTQHEQNTHILKMKLFFYRCWSTKLNEKYLLMQCTAGVSSNRLRQTVQNFLLWWVGSDQQCATGFLIIQGAIPEQGVMTFVTHLSCTMKLQTETKDEKVARLVFWRLMLALALKTIHREYSTPIFNTLNEVLIKLLEYLKRDNQTQVKPKKKKTFRKPFIQS